MKNASLYLLALWPGIILGADLPEPVLPQGVGVNIHFNRGHEKDLDLIAAAGFKCIRMDLGWSGIERDKEHYDWSAYDELTGNLDKRGLRALFILDYSNPLYEETAVSKNPVTGKEDRSVASPQHPESVAAFARWAAAAVEHFKGRRVLWEIWNEPNITFWRPKPDVRQYNTLALAAAQAMRRADPQATIIGPASSGFPWEFLESFLQSGILEYLNAVSVHPYRGYDKSPETAGEDYRRLRTLIEKCAPEGKKNLPILSGEWGYASHSRGVSLETQAAFLVRQQLANLVQGVPLSIWYDWKNDGTDPAEREHNFGTVNHDLTPKPAYHAVKILTRELAGYRIERRLETGNSKDFLLVLTNPGGERRLTAWTLDQPHRMAFDLDFARDKKWTGTTGMGEPFTPIVEANRLQLDVGPLPVYMACP
jgi:hypothetical protein